jgi:integrase
LFVVDEEGRPVEESAFTKQFRRALIAANLPHLHFHGLRHTAGAALAEAGCSAKEIMAVLGHKTSAMVTKYTEGAEQRRLASAAIKKLQEAGKNGNGTGKSQT